MILGEGDAVPIRNVVSLEQRVRAPGKTWGLVGGLALLLLGRLSGWNRGVPLPAMPPAPPPISRP